MSITNRAPVNIPPNRSQQPLLLSNKATPGRINRRCSSRWHWHQRINSSSRLSLNCPTRLQSIIRIWSRSSISMHLRRTRYRLHSTQRYISLFKHLRTIRMHSITCPSYPLRLKESEVRIIHILNNSTNRCIPSITTFHPWSHSRYNHPSHSSTIQHTQHILNSINPCQLILTWPLHIRSNRQKYILSPKEIRVLF